jgi:hypothetical protein
VFILSFLVLFFFLLLLFHSVFFQRGSLLFIMRSGRVDKFFLTPPVIGNVFQDSFFQSILRRHGLLQSFPSLEQELVKLGQRCSSSGDITRLGDEAEANPPKFVPYGPWGHRIDRIEVSQAWKTLQGEHYDVVSFFFCWCLVVPKTKQNNRK